MRIDPQRAIDNLRRRASGRPLRATLALVLLFGLIGAYQPFFIYDWIQQAIAARINLRPYDGDVTVVAIDHETMQRWKATEVPPDQLAALVDALGALQPRQLVIDRLRLAKGNPAGAARLGEALSRVTPQPALFVTLTPRDNTAATDMVSEQKSGDGSGLVVETDGQAFWSTVQLASWLSWSTPFGAPNGLPQTQLVSGKAYPSLSELLAGRPADGDGGSVVDVSLDPGSIPIVSAAAVLDGSVGRSRLSGRRLLISSTADTVLDTYRTPHGRFVPRAYLIVAGADTIVNGPQRHIGWIPAYLVAVLGALGWLLLRPRQGRLAALAALLLVLAGSVALERALVFQESSTAVFLLLSVALAHAIAGVRSSLALARNAVEAKSWFLAQASHDLRQPIHAIGMLSARLSQTRLSPDQVDLVGKIDRSVDGASRMFQSLLDIATIESGTLKPVFASVGVDELFSDIEGQNALAAERAGVTLRFVPSSLTLVTDRSLALTMLQNVVSNAIKYATGKQVLIGCRRQGSTAMLCVYDRGAGISREDLRQVTQAFFRASRNTAGAEGAGLGLAIVHRLADLLNLKLTIRSTPGHGTAVTMAGFRLGERAARLPQAAAAAVAASPLAGLKVLLVDDDLDSLRAMEPLLDQWGCDVTAVDRFPLVTESFDAIVSDYDFGKGETLARYRAAIGDLVQRGTVMIVLSGHPPGTVRHALGQESLLILAKPVRAAELRAVLLSAKLRGAG